jgi:hypothetical protein
MHLVPHVFFVFGIWWLVVGVSDPRANRHTNQWFRTIEKAFAGVNPIFLIKALLEREGIFHRKEFYLF